MYAVDAGAENVAEYLKQFQAEVNAKNVFGLTAEKIGNMKRNQPMINMVSSRSSTASTQVG